VPQQNWLRCVRGVGGLVLGQDPRSGPGPVDAADWKDLGVLGLPHPAGPLHPHQEAHPHRGEDTWALCRLHTLLLSQPLAKA